MTAGRNSLPLLAIATVGVSGSVLSRLGYHVTGLLLLTLYALAGLDGLAH